MREKQRGKQVDGGQWTFSGHQLEERGHSQKEDSRTAWMSKVKKLTLRWCGSLAIQVLGGFLWLEDGGVEMSENRRTCTEWILRSQDQVMISWLHVILQYIHTCRPEGLWQ